MSDLSKFVKTVDDPLIPSEGWIEVVLQSLTPEARDTLSKLSAGTHVLVPINPTDSEIDRACMSYRHDFGLLKPPDASLTRSTAKLWLEAWIKGLEFQAAQEEGK